jgi:molybdate transport system regulatory protein
MRVIDFRHMSTVPIMRHFAAATALPQAGKAMSAKKASRKLPTLTEALGHQVSDKRLDILRRIGEVGSISQAARDAGVSYKAAWQALETLSNLAGAALIEKVVGGAGGGGARLTVAGQQLLRASDEMQTVRKNIMQKLERDTGAPRLPALGLRTSMRNQLPCTIKAMKKQGASLRVELLLAEDMCLYARVTRESAELLELASGLDVLALCKATAVTIARSIEPRDGFNLLQGLVSRATAKDQEVTVQLPGGLQLVGFTFGEHRLKPGHAAIASLEEAAVVIAITA